jgi:hypothetical protein
MPKVVEVTGYTIQELKGRDDELAYSQARETVLGWVLESFTDDALLGLDGIVNTELDPLGIDVDLPNQKFSTNGLQWEERCGQFRVTNANRCLSVHDFCVLLRRGLAGELTFGGTEDSPGAVQGYPRWSYPAPQRFWVLQPAVGDGYIEWSPISEGGGLRYLWNEEQLPHLTERAQEFEAWVEEVLQGVREYIEECLQGTYDWLTSEEYLFDMADANGYIFDKYGRII